MGMLIMLSCFIACAPGKPFWVSWTLEDSEHALLRSRESLQVSSYPIFLPIAGLLPLWASTALMHDSMQLITVYHPASKLLHCQEATTRCFCTKLCLHQFACADYTKLISQQCLLGVALLLFASIISCITESRALARQPTDLL